MEDPNGRISKMDAILFALVLEVSLLQIRILEGSIELRAPQLRAADNSNKMKLDKLLIDRGTVKEIMRRTLIEISDNGEYSSLQRAVGVFIKRASSALSKRIQHERLRDSCEEILCDLKSKRNCWTTELRNADQKVAWLRDKTKDDLMNANTRLCFAEKWLCARAESLDLQYQRRAPAPAPSARHEQRVHEELLKTFQLQTEEHETAIEHWRVRYTNDIARMNELLIEKREQLQVVVARHEELQKLFNLHEGEMRSWLSFKQQRADRLAREKRVREAATRIQAWWRGVMVRRALGSYRYLRNVKKSPTKTKKK